MFEADQRAETVDSSLGWRPASGWRTVGLGVVEFEAPAGGGIGEAAGWHAQEHRFSDPTWDLVAVHRGAVGRVDDRLHSYVAAGVGEEAANLAQCDRSDTFEAADAAAVSRLAALVAGECFFAEVMCSITCGRSLRTSTRDG